jgi:hypothetical protein
MANQELLKEVYAFWKKWFDQTNEIKARYKRGLHGSGGWYPAYSEGPGLEGVKDHKEYFHFRTCHFGLHSVTKELFEHAYEKAHSSIIKKNTKLSYPPENHVLRIIRYFESDQEIVGQAHKDFDLLTVAYPGTRPGLEVSLTGEHFLPFEPSPKGTIHGGEMFEIMSTHKAMLHRVRTDGQERLSAVFFYNPDLDLELSPGYTAKDYLNKTLKKAGTLDYKL